MPSIIYHILFLVISIIIFLRTIAYGIYEWKEMKNHSGSIAVILLALSITAFSNIMVWLN